MTRPLQVFLCHASQDKPEVWKLHRYLKTRGVKPWLDVEDLLPGEDWEVEIPKALYASDVILVCLSKNSVNKEGYVQKEIAFALDKAMEKPEGTIFIIPVKLEDCELPKRLSRYHSVDLFRTDGRKRLLMGLNKRVANLAEEVLPLKIEDTKQRTLKSLKPEIIKQEEKSIESQPASQVEKRNDENKIIPAIEEKKELPKPFTRVLNPASLNSQKKSEPKEHKQNYNFSRLGIGGIILIIVAGFLFAGNYFLNNLPVSQTPEIKSTEIIPIEITFTSTFAPTATATKSLAISTTTRFDIGSTTLGSDAMVLMYVPAGEFTMGSDYNSDEQPIHQVTLDAFWIDQTEVTNEKYALCVNTGRCNSPSDTELFLNEGYANHPVVYVSWEDANTYCEWAGRRLPTEAQWEKAARGPNANLYPWGNETPNSGLLNYNSVIGETTEGGNYPQGASIYGAYDMSGNVWEWVNDWYDLSYYQNSPASNPLGPSTGDVRVLRGGAWNYDFSSILSANREWENPSYTDVSLGFRCALSQ